MGRLPPEFRIWRLIKLGVPLGDIDNMPARLGDWLLCIQGVADQVESDQAERSSRPQSSGGMMYGSQSE